MRRYPGLPTHLTHLTHQAYPTYLTHPTYPAYPAFLGRALPFHDFGIELTFLAEIDVVGGGRILLGERLEIRQLGLDASKLHAGKESAGGFPRLALVRVERNQPLHSHRQTPCG